MANEIQVSGRLTINSQNSDIVPASNAQLTLSLPSGSSYNAAFTQNISSNTWVALITGSATQIRYMAVTNGTLNNTSSFVNIATDAAGTKGFSTLQPNDFIVLPGSGSGTTPTNYFFNAVSAPAQLQVIIVQY